MKRRLTDEVKYRACLGGCGKGFLSEHSGQRICPRCRNKKAWQDVDIAIHEAPRRVNRASAEY